MMYQLLSYNYWIGYTLTVSFTGMHVQTQAYAWDHFGLCTVYWESLVAIMFESGWIKFWENIVRQMNGLTKKLSIVTVNIDGFSLTNCWWFTKFTKLFLYHTFLLYGTTYIECSYIGYSAIVVL